jgi:hypothetical protein
MIEDHEFEECPCEQCGECVFEVDTTKQPPERYCRRPKSVHAKVSDSRDERFVRDHWVNQEHLNLYQITPEKYSFNWSWDGGVVGLFVNPKEAWAAARAFTEKRLEEIRQVEEEIRWLKATVAWRHTKGFEVDRIVAREHAALERLKAGMKEPV